MVVTMKLYQQQQQKNEFKEDSVKVNNQFNVEYTQCIHTVHSVYDRMPDLVKQIRLIQTSIT